MFGRSEEKWVRRVRRVRVSEAGFGGFEVGDVSEEGRRVWGREGRWRRVLVWLHYKGKWRVRGRERDRICWRFVGRMEFGGFGRGRI